MVIQYASDLHLEFRENWFYLRDVPLIPSADMLILAGDIAAFDTLDQFDEFFDRLAAQFKFVFWLPGNHEYYRYDLGDKCGSFCEEIRPNIFLVNNWAITIKGVRLIFSTLWSHIRLENQLAVTSGMNDFRLISYQGKRFSAQIYNQQHKSAVEFITNELMHLGGELKSVVVTHHVPTFRNYPGEFRDSTINNGFATELDELIENKGPDFWIYGHHHRNIPEFCIGKTRLLTNQLGYVGVREHLLFDVAKTLEIPGVAV